MFQSSLGLRFLIFLSLFYAIKSKCSGDCQALGSYYLRETTLSFIAKVTNSKISDILSYNPQIRNEDFVEDGTRVNVPFICDCINGEFLGHVFTYRVKLNDTYDRITGIYYANLTTSDWVKKFNIYGQNSYLEEHTRLNVTVNCSCGNSAVSRDYGLFITYPLRSDESLTLVAAQTNFSLDLLQKYNPETNVSVGDTIVYIPGKDKDGSYRPLKSSSGSSFGLILEASSAGLVGVLLVAVFICVRFHRKREVKHELRAARSDQARHATRAPGNSPEKATDKSGVTLDRSVKFSYKELAKATDNFSLANKIGEGGFGAVYYAKLRGEKVAIKMMDMRASEEFLAELKVLTHVHHLNLVRLIGYCATSSLFLVYEFIENGNLSQHLRGSDRDPLPWTTRVRIALDSARGLEYIHEHTVPAYIHRDIKSANILIDKNYHAKIADFGLAKLSEVGSIALPTRLVGTFGYMPPEYARRANVSTQVDVYAFGVVLYELISGKEAIVEPTGSVTEEYKSLVGLFNEVLSQPDPREGLLQLIDPRLGKSCSFDSVCKMAMLAQACTQENPQLRPSMRSIVVALVTLLSTTEDWDVDSFYKNQALVRLMSGR